MVALFSVVLEHTLPGAGERSVLMDRRVVTTEHSVNLYNRTLYFWLARDKQVPTRKKEREHFVQGSPKALRESTSQREQLFFIKVIFFRLFTSSFRHIYVIYSNSQLAKAEPVSL